MRFATTLNTFIRNIKERQFEKTICCSLPFLMHRYSQRYSKKIITLLCRFGLIFADKISSDEKGYQIENQESELSKIKQTLPKKN